MGPRIVLDTNVLLSGALYRGRPHLCLRLASEHIVHNVSCDWILTEFATKLIQRFGFSPQRADQARTRVHGFSECITATRQITGVCRDPDDDQILDCAVQGNAETVVTGDKDLLALTPFDYPSPSGRIVRIELLTPAQFIATLAKDL